MKQMQKAKGNLFTEITNGSPNDFKLESKNNMISETMVNSFCELFIVSLLGHLHTRFWLLLEAKLDIGTPNDLVTSQ